MAARVTEKLNLIKAEFTADTQLSSLSVGQREQVAIVAVLLQNPQILILDEPTASLSNREVEHLFEIIAMLKSQGVTIIYISHHLDEVFRITNTITILRDSRVRGTFSAGKITHEEVVALMIGRKLEEFYPKENVQISSPILEVKNLKDGNIVKDVGFTLRSGEILGFAGLVGAGRTESMLVLYGVNRRMEGEIKINGTEYVPKSPWAAKKAGIAFVPEDRRNEGIVSSLSIVQNLSLSFTELLAKFGIIKRSLEERFCNTVIKNLSIIIFRKPPAMPVRLEKVMPCRA
jgi:ribose transport system ATP-binding protein